MRRVNVCLMVISLAIAVGACSSTPTTPTTTAAPSPTTPPPTPATVTSVVVTGPASSTTSFQVIATARMSDATSQDVTASARWESSDAALATIASTGLVTIVGSGAVTLKATYQNISGSMQTQVTRLPPSKFRLSGSVWEVDPNAHKIAGALILVVGGADAGASTLSDENGNYAFASITAGVISLVGTKDGYLISSPEGINISGDRQVDVFMAPTPPKDRNGNTATARCSDKSWSWAQTRAEACTANGGMEYPVCPGVLCPLNAR